HYEGFETKTRERMVRPTGIEPVPPRWRRGMLPPHPGRTRPVLLTGLLPSVGCQRPRSRVSVVGFTASHRFRRQDFRLTRRGSPRAQNKTKKVFQGVALEGLFLLECRAF